jgi:hypothetical protein
VTTIQQWETEQAAALYQSQIVAQTALSNPVQMAAPLPSASPSVPVQQLPAPVQPLPAQHPSSSIATVGSNWSEELIRLQQQNGEVTTKLNAEGALRNTIQYEAQKLFPEISRINAENMELFGRLTDASVALGEAKLYSAKGWALWQKV